MLAAMFSGRHEVETTEDGSFFIDRDGTYFRFILNYLRNGELILPEGATFLEELEVEARFYQVQGLLDELKVARALKVFEKSVILTDRDFRNVLIRWIPMEFILAGEWRLLFRASRDGFTGSAFHSRCENKGPTVTVVNSNGNIFGGFTESAWAGKTYNTAFDHIFSILERICSIQIYTFRILRLPTSQRYIFINSTDRVNVHRMATKLPAMLPSLSVQLSQPEWSGTDQNVAN